MMNKNVQMHAVYSVGSGDMGAGLAGLTVVTRQNGMRFITNYKSTMCDSRSDFMWSMELGLLNMLLDLAKQSREWSESQLDESLLDDDYEAQDRLFRADVDVKNWTELVRGVLWDHYCSNTGVYQHQVHALLERVKLAGRMTGFDDYESVATAVTAVMAEFGYQNFSSASRPIATR